MAEKSHEGLKWVMRAGYGARGAIYVLVGILAFWAALYQAYRPAVDGAGLIGPARRWIKVHRA